MRKRFLALAVLTVYLCMTTVSYTHLAPIPDAVRQIYRREDAEPIDLRRQEIEQMGITVREFPLVDDGVFARHAPLKLAQALMDVLDEFR